MRKVPGTMLSQAGTEQLQETFNRFDTDQNGLIDRTEFDGLLEVLGAGLSKVEADTAFGDIDSNGDGRITFNEFGAWWRVPADSRQSRR